MVEELQLVRRYRTTLNDFDKPMGIATYKTANELPKKYKGLLSDAKTLKKLME